MAARKHLIWLSKISRPGLGWCLLTTLLKSYVKFADDPVVALSWFLEVPTWMNVCVDVSSS